MFSCSAPYYICMFLENEMGITNLADGKKRSNSTQIMLKTATYKNHGLKSNKMHIHKLTDI